MKKVLVILALGCGLWVSGCQKNSGPVESKVQTVVIEEPEPEAGVESNLELYSEGEPSISEVQQAAIKWAELEPERIAKWRKQAAKKAWLPELSIGIDNNSTDLWHWETGSTTKFQDDVLRKGEGSMEWDVSLSWELGDLIWNDDQTSIDVRSNLAVSLRRSILDEVTERYFTRLRIKMELDSLSIEERKKRLEKELKLKELTASIDALTGGYFSKALKGG